MEIQNVIYCGVCHQYILISKRGMLYRRITIFLERVFGPFTFWFKCPYCKTKISVQTFVERKKGEKEKNDR